ncbi:hypothetical protein L210DRAFT_3645092 [Boletus edulis BED1]|uniref:Uncharacterized protein n=1 Tax=Boletus edulis BED1 TaxID=1328754 RepID=A0AAD4BVH9_BOLED|nr:hypothetical protein L210DRAFT_3645092 [Boletus edulis BED1]
MSSSSTQPSFPSPSRLYFRNVLIGVSAFIALCGLKIVHIMAEAATEDNDSDETPALESLKQLQSVVGDYISKSDNGTCDDEAGADNIPRREVEAWTQRVSKELLPYQNIVGTSVSSPSFDDETSMGSQSNCSAAKLVYDDQSGGDEVAAVDFDFDFDLDQFVPGIVSRDIHVQQAAISELVSMLNQAKSASLSPSVPS